MRHAMTIHPGASYFWYLDSSALIMNPSIALESHLLKPARLEKVMIINAPVVPPDSVIKTFANLKGDRIDLIITQDKDGLVPSSFVIRNGDWAKYFLDAWFDPIYRSYNFQKAESHALEHIVQYVTISEARREIGSSRLTWIQMARHDPRQTRNGPAEFAERVCQRPCESQRRRVQRRRSGRHVPRLRQGRQDLLERAGTILGCAGKGQGLVA